MIGWIVGDDEVLETSRAGVIVFIWVAKASLKSKYTLDSTPKYACTPLCLIILLVALLLLAAHFINQIRTHQFLLYLCLPNDFFFLSFWVWMHSIGWQVKQASGKGVSNVMQVELC